MWVCWGGGGMKNKKGQGWLIGFQALIESGKDKKNYKTSFFEKLIISIGFFTILIGLFGLLKINVEMVESDIMKIMFLLSFIVLSYLIIKIILMFWEDK